MNGSSGLVYRVLQVVVVYNERFLGFSLSCNTGCCYVVVVYNERFLGFSLSCITGCCSL